MSKSRFGRCQVCGDMNDLKHLSLYVIGSEGLDICPSCEVVLVNMVRGLIEVGKRCRLGGYKAAKEVAEAKRIQDLREAAAIEQQQ